MTTEKNSLDYGIYIDGRVAFIVSLDHNVHDTIVDQHKLVRDSSSSGTGDMHQQTHMQNSSNEHLKKFCKLILARLEKAHSILIFGPSESKFELQKELRDSKELRHIKEELLVTDHLEQEAASRFVQNHYQKVAG